MAKLKPTEAVTHGTPINADSANEITYVESNPSDGFAPADQGQKVDTRFRIHFHSRRRRLTDPDGLYSKAALDGLVRGGILVDDSAKFVKEVSFSQEVSEREETIITVGS